MCSYCLWCTKAKIWNEDLKKQTQIVNFFVVVIPLRFKDEDVDLWGMFVLETLADLPRLVPVSCCQQVWGGSETL